MKCNLASDVLMSGHDVDHPSPEVVTERNGHAPQRTGSSIFLLWCIFTLEHRTEMCKIRDSLNKLEIAFFSIRISRHLTAKYTVTSYYSTNTSVVNV